MKMGDLLPRVIMVLVALGLLITQDVSGQAKFPDYNFLSFSGYESQVEYTTRDQKNVHTFFVDEYHDIDGQKGRVEIDFVDRSSVYYFSDTNEVVTITYEGRPICTVSSLDALPILETETLWGWLDKKHKVVGPTAILFRPTKKPPVYVRKDKIRGITVNVFEAEDVVDDVIITYYIITDDWKWINTTTKVQIPVRVMAIGNTGLDTELDTEGNDTITSFLNMTLDFLRFKPSLSSQQVFRIPTGIGCMGLRIPSEKLPSIEERYSFLVERYVSNEDSSLQTSLHLNKIWFDSSNGLCRIDSSGVTQVEDYNTGVAYVILKNDTCVIGPILNNGANTNSLVSAMKDPKSFLQFDGYYYYLGRDYYRGIFCDIWETLRNNMTGLPTATIFTYYFMVDKIQIVTEGDQNYQPPVALVITGYNGNNNVPDLHEVYNYFDFDQTDGRLLNEIMSVGKCFPAPNQKKKLAILFEPKESVTVSRDWFLKYFLSLETFALLEIASGASVSIIRIPFYELTLENTGLQAVIELTERPHILAGFYIDMKGIRPATNMQRVKSVESIEECAKQCVETSLPICNSFLICENECYVGDYDGTTEWQDGFSGKNNCDLFIRSVRASAENLLDLELKDAVVALQNSIKNRRLNIKAEDMFENNTMDFVATKMEEIRIAPASVEFELVAERRQLSGEMMLELELNNDTTLEACHKHCKLESRMFCNSFSYCPSTKVCRISSIYLTSGTKVTSKETEVSTQCSVFRVTPLALFDETPGRVPLLDGDLKVPGVENKEQCALKCQMEDAFKCRGFEYCQDLKNCVLHKVHVLDMAETVAAGASCTHYSKKYSSEFTYMGYVLINDPRSIMIHYVSFEDCARRCYLQLPSNPCRSFNFESVPGLDGEVVLNECIMNTLSIYDDGVQTLTSKKYSLHINAELIPLGPVTTTPRPTGKPTYYPIWDTMLAGEYRITAEFKRKPEKVSFFVNEYHNVYKRESRMDMKDPDSGNTQSFFFFSETQQVAMIRDQKCTVATMRQALSPRAGIEWGWVDMKRLIVGPSSILWRDTQDTPQFTEKKSVRGQLCNVFSAKDRLDPGVDITYYVPENDWKTASGTRYEFPARVRINGTYASDNQTVAIDTQYDFVYFTTNFIADKNNIMVPKGLGCKNLQSRDARVMPKLEPMYSFVAEKYSSLDGEIGIETYVDLERIWYDENTGIVLTEYHNRNHTKVKEANDYNTGVSYTFVNDKCTNGPIKLSDSFVRNGRSQPKNAIKTAQEFLEMDGTYYYLGDESWRGINCEVWEGIKENVEADNVTFSRVVHTIYLTTSKYLGAKGGMLETRIPVRILLNIQMIKNGQSYQIEYNVFDYDDYRTKTEVKMDIPTEKCFLKPEQRKYFTISYPIPNTDSTKVGDPKYGLNSDFQTLVAYAANISTLRIPTTELQYIQTGDQILVNGLMVEKSPMMAQFYNYQKDVPALRQTVKISGLEDLEACASFCLNENHIKNCKSLSFCKTNNVLDCFVSQQDAYDVRNSTVVQDDNKNCQLYIRGNLNITDFDIPLTTAVDNLLANTNKLKIQELNLLPTKVEVKDAPFVVQKSYELLKSKTQLNGKSVRVITKPTGSVEECYAECVRDTRTACISFSYCNNGAAKCRISSIYFKSEFDSNPVIYKEQTVYNTQCNLYIRKAIQFFDETRGKVPTVKGNRVLPEIKSPDECALACKNEQQFKCEGLEYCQSSHTCVLLDTHVLDIPESSMVSKPEFCTHYSLSYAYEFEDIGELELDDPQARIFRSVSFQECARLCQTIPGLNCRSINFCEDKFDSKPIVECVLNTKILDGNIKAKVKDRVCHHYKFTGIERITNDTTPKPTMEPNVTTNPIPITDPNDMVFPDIKELFFQGYEVESEINDHKLSKIYTVYEYHDLKNKRGRVDSLVGGNRTSEFYTSHFTTSVKIQDEKCTVGGQGDDEWGWFDNKNLILGPSAMLFRQLNEDASFNGQRYIRGILCSQFTARDKTDVGVTLNFYFSANKWSSSSGQPLQIPVRLTAKGKYIRSSSMPIEIDTSVDFVGFQPKETRDDIFMIPKGVGCDGLKQTGHGNIPPIQNKISYSQEIYFPSDNLATQVLQSKNYFDFTGKLFKTEGVEDGDKFWEVMDFNTGVTYQLKRGICVGIQSIQSVLFSEDTKGVVKPMKTTEQFLGLDGEFYYLGREYYRGVSCNIWESVKKDFYIMGTRNERAVVTAFFMSPTFLPTMEGDSNMQVPVLIIYKTWVSEKLTKEYRIWKFNLFEFDQNDNKDFYNEMDIEPCVEPEQKVHFLIYFSSNITISSIAERNDKEFRNQAIVTAAKAANVSQLRIKLESVNYNKNNIAVMGMIFGRPPFRRGFILYGNEEPATNDQKRLDFISDPEICAQKCLEESSCKGFTMCNNNLAKSACFLTSRDKNDKGWGGTVPEYDKCQLYFRSTADSKIDEISIETAITNLNDNINQEKFIINIDKIRILANRMDERVTPIGFDDDINYEDVFENRKLRKDSHTTIDLGSDSAGSAIECYERCVKESSLECMSFSFCHTDRGCRLSSVFVVGSRNSSSLDELEPEVATRCGVYRRNAIKLFDKLPGRPSLGHGDKVSTTASAEECALQCKKESDFKCLGFEFCDQSSGCVLHKTLLLDLPINSKKAKICTYYAAKYSTEFADLGRFVLIEPKTTSEKGVTFEQCAKLCVDAGEKCRSINYCPDMVSLSTSRCDLNTLSDQDEGTALVEAQTCSYYFKRSLQKLIRLPESSELVSPGKFTGIAFILIFVGIGLGVAGYIGASWYKKKRQNPANVRFVDTTELVESTR